MRVRGALHHATDRGIRDFPHSDCSFYAVNHESNTGRADEVYRDDKALRDLQQLTADKFTEVLGGLLQYYVQNVTS